MSPNYSAQFSVKSNVCMRKFDKHNNLEQEFVGSNRVTKLGIIGIVKFINGEFNDSNYEILSNYIPKYLAVGTNRPDVSVTGISTEVTVNDSRLLSEISPRILITKRNSIENQHTDEYMKLIIKCYIPSDLYVGQTIREAGLFCNSTGNNCWARIGVTDIYKEEGSVIDVTWEITIISLKSESQPYNNSSSVDKSVLGGYLDSYGNPDYYTDTSYASFKPIYDISRAVYSYDNATQDSVTLQANNINTAAASLVKAAKLTITSTISGGIADTTTQFEYQLTDASNNIIQVNGSNTFKLLNNASVTTGKLLVGSTYTITELNIDSKYKSTYTNNKLSVTIAAYSNSVTYVNATV